MFIFFKKKKWYKVTWYYPAYPLCSEGSQTVVKAASRGEACAKVINRKYPTIAITQVEEKED